jgi:hypothetical protein
MAQLEDMQFALCLELVSCDDVGVAGREVDRCACDSSRDHGGGDAGGDEGRDCHNHGAAVVAFLPEEDELAIVSFWQSHEHCCCLHLPYAAGWRLLLLLSLAGGGGSFFSSCSGGGAVKMALTVPVSRSFLS